MRPASFFFSSCSAIGSVVHLRLDDLAGYRIDLIFILIAAGAELDLIDGVAVISQKI